MPRQAQINPGAFPPPVPGASLPHADPVLELAQRLPELWEEANALDTRAGPDAEEPDPPGDEERAQALDEAIVTIESQIAVLAPASLAGAAAQLMLARCLAEQLAGDPALADAPEPRQAVERLERLICAGLRVVAREANIDLREIGGEHYACDCLVGDPALAGL